jgi:hypothetical protein
LGKHKGSFYFLTSGDGVDTVQPLHEEINMNFRKTILAISLSACTGAAVAADKVPTLGDVIKASGIGVTGYIDTSYNYISSDTGTSFLRVFDTENRGFNLQMVDVAISYLPASGFGGFVQLDAGSDAKVIASNSTGGDDFEVQEAYAQYTAGGFNVIGGKFATLAGAEVIESPANTNFSRSYLFGFAIPFTHTGMRATYAPSDTLKFIAGVNNGWDILRKSAGTPPAPDSKTVELGVSASPVKMFSIAASYYDGKENSSVSGLAGDRKVLDIVATFNLTDALSLVLNYDDGEQDKATATSGTAEWKGLAAYVNYKFSDQWRGSLRTEKFEDKNCFRTTCAFASQELKETTVTVGYAPAANFELRAEIRKDKSDQAVFTEDGQAKTKQDSIGLEAIYKF